MDNRRVIKFFPKPGDAPGEVRRLINIMRQDGYELLTFTISPSSAATLVFQRPGDEVPSPETSGTKVETGA